MDVIVFDEESLDVIVGFTFTVESKDKNGMYLEPVQALKRTKAGEVKEIKAKPRHLPKYPFKKVIVKGPRRLELPITFAERQQPTA